jgi:hypothetical protein
MNERGRVAGAETDAVLLPATDDGAVLSAFMFERRRAPESWRAL